MIAVMSPHIPRYIHFRRNVLTLVTFYIYGTITVLVITVCPNDVSAAATGVPVGVRFGIVVTNPSQEMLLNRESKRVLSDAMKSFSKNRLSFGDKLRIVDPLVISLDANLSPINILNVLCKKLLPKRVNALLFVTFDDESRTEEANAVQYLFQLLSFLRLPVITWRPQNTGQVQNDLLVLQMSSTIAHQTAAIFSILERYKYNQVSIIVVKSSGDDVFLNAMLQERDTGPFRPKILSVVKIDSVNETDVLKRMKTFEGSPSRVFVLYASKNSATLVFKTATSLGLTGTDYLWICMQKVIGDIATKTYQPPSEFPIGMLGIDLEMTANSLVKTVGNGMRIYGHALDILVKEGNYSGDQFSPNVSCKSDEAWDLGQDFFKAMHKVVVPIGGTNKQKIEFLPDGSVKFAEFNITNLSYDYEKRTRVWTTVGSWNTETGLQLRDIVWPGSQAVPPRGKPERYHFNIATLEEVPYVIMKQPDLTGQCESRSAPCRRRPENWTSEQPDTWQNMCCTGLCIDLLLRLSIDIGFTYDLYRVEDGMWGGLKGGQWNGLMADLVNKKAHFSMTSLKVTEERQRAIAFSMIYLETGISIVVAKREGVISPTAFLEPFDYVTWIVLVVVCVQTVSIFIFLFEWLSPSGFDMQLSVQGEKQRFSFLRVYWLVFATFFGTTCPVTLPRSFTAKALTAVWGICSLVFFTVYTANLATFMITREEVYELKGIDDSHFSNARTITPPFRFGTIGSGATSETISKAYPEIFGYMDNRRTVAEGIEAVKNGELDAFLYDATVLEYRVGIDQGCRILTTGSWFASTGYAIAFPLGSTLIPLFDEHLLVYQRNGYLEQLQKFWLTGACKQKIQKQDKSSHALGIKNFTSAFIFLGVGVVCGIACLISEWIYFHCLRLGFCQWLYACKMCRFLSLNISRSISAAKLQHQGSSSNLSLDYALTVELIQNSKALRAAKAEVEKLENIQERLRRVPGKMKLCRKESVYPTLSLSKGFFGRNPERNFVGETEKLNVVELETVL